MYTKINSLPKKKILFVSPGSRSEATPFISDIKKINIFNCDAIYTKPNLNDYYSNKQSIFLRILSKLRIPYDKYKINLRLLNKINENKYDFVFIIKGNLIKPTTLKKIKKISKKTKIISWNSDDMMQSHNSSYYYLLSIKYYDLIVTTKFPNTLPNELQRYGAKKILLQDNSYIETIHRPLIKKITKPKKSPILFVGFAEKDRFRSMNFLAKNGIKVDIYGSGWEKSFYKLNAHHNLNINTRNLVGDEYSEAISNAYISLCFLRKINRDVQTARSVEIPACLGLMLAERTDEHIKMFEEDKEAVYFSSDNELLEKINYLINNEHVRDEIAKNGYRKCMKSKMSYIDRLNVILENC